MKSKLPIRSALLLPAQFRGPEHGSTRQLENVSTARASRQAGSNHMHEPLKACNPLKRLASSLTPCAALLASALVAVSPAAATLGPTDILELQETLTEVWGEQNLTAPHCA